MLGNLEIAAFCDQLSMIVSAGIPIYEGISILQEDAPEEETAEILSVISNSLDHGSSFCDALRGNKCISQICSGYDRDR